MTRTSARQIGISGDSAVGALEQIAMAMRYNPGTTALFQFLTGQKPGGTVNDMMVLLRKLREQPQMLGAQWASQFGISQEMFTMLMAPGALEEMEGAMKRRIQINQDLGVSTDDLAKQSREYQNALRDVVANIDTLGTILGKSLIPAFDGLNTIIQNIIRLWTHAPVTQTPSQRGRGGQVLTPGTVHQPTYLESVWSRMGELSGDDQTNTPMYSKYPSGSFSGASKSLSGKTSMRQFAINAARAFGIPPEIFLALIGVESGWDPQAVSSAGAMGLTQLMKDTAGGINRLDPEANMSRGAQFLSQLHGKFGNWRDALSAYNTHGESTTNFAPGYGYADTVLGKAQSMAGGAMINAPVNVTVNAPGGNPEAVRSAAKSGVEDGLSSAMRNSLGALGHGGPVVASP